METPTADATTGHRRDARISWRETRERMRADRVRLRELARRADGSLPTRLALLYPSYASVWFHRLSHYAFERRWRFFARLVWQVAFWTTGSDVNPASDIGGGLVILHPAAISFSGRAGRNLTMSALSGVGALHPRTEDVGAGPGFPVIGDDVVLGPHSGVMGPVRIGDRVRLLGVIAKVDVPADTVLEADEPKFVRASTS
ncbi:MAG: serine acetyltransferase [Planctomycetota bacterium]